MLVLTMDIIKGLVVWKLVLLLANKQVTAMRFAFSNGNVTQVDLSNIRMKDNNMQIQFILKDKL